MAKSSGTKGTTAPTTAKAEERLIEESGAGWVQLSASWVTAPASSGQGVERDGKRITSEELTEACSLGDNHSLVKVTVYALNKNGTTTADVAVSEVGVGLGQLKKAFDA
jgi:hypothetical protein